MIEWYVIRCCNCGNIQSKSFSVELNKAIFHCQKCNKSIKLHDARKGSIKLDFWKARDCKVATELCKELKYLEGKENETN